MSLAIGKIGKSKQQFILLLLFIQIYSHKKGKTGVLALTFSSYLPL